MKNIRVDAIVIMEDTNFIKENIVIREDAIVIRGDTIQAKRDKNFPKVFQNIWRALQWENNYKLQNFEEFLVPQKKILLPEKYNLGSISKTFVNLDNFGQHQQFLQYFKLVSCKQFWGGAKVESNGVLVLTRFATLKVGQKQLTNH